LATEINSSVFRPIHVALNSNLKSLLALVYPPVNLGRHAAFQSSTNLRSIIVRKNPNLCYILPDPKITQPIGIPMAIKKFTFYSLGRDLDNLAPGFGITVDYEILESLIRAAVSAHPPGHLRDELRQLAEIHHCDFRDFEEQKFVHFTRKDG
jgi:hypothetical protein